MQRSLTLDRKTIEDIWAVILLKGQHLSQHDQHTPMLARYIPESWQELPSGYVNSLLLKMAQSK